MLFVEIFVEVLSKDVFSRKIMHLIVQLVGGDRPHHFPPPMDSPWHTLRRKKN